MREMTQVLLGLNAWSVLFRLLLAAVFGGCIGLERGKHNRAAGLRTHILVCVGSAVTILVGLYTAQELGFTGDPMRIGAQVISGIGFLGAGTILHRDHTQVTGLTTAAGLWTTASIGLALGVGAYWIALVAFAIMMVTVVLLIRLERSSKRPSVYTYYLEVESVDRINALSEQLRELLGESTYAVDIIPAKSGLAPHVGVILTVARTCDGKALLSKLRGIEYMVAAVSVGT